RQLLAIGAGGFAVLADTQHEIPGQSGKLPARTGGHGELSCGVRRACRSGRRARSWHGAIVLQQPVVATPARTANARDVDDVGDDTGLAVEHVDAIDGRTADDGMAASAVEAEKRQHEADQGNEVVHGSPSCRPDWGMTATCCETAS